MGRIITAAGERVANIGLPDRLLRVMERLKLKKKAELADAVDSVSGGAWSRWFQHPPGAFPRYRVLYRFASLGINLNWLVFNGVGEPEMRSDALPVEASIARVRQIVVDRIRSARGLSRAEEASIPSGDALIEFIAGAVRKTL